MDKTITAICRKCSKPAPAAEFRIDLVLKQMVCKSCFRAQHPKKEVMIEKPKEALKDKKPVDWDKIDEELSRKAAENDALAVMVQEIGNTGKARYRCKRCSYTFKYDLIAKTPQRCPYCDATLPRLRTT